MQEQKRSDKSVESVRRGKNLLSEQDSCKKGKSLVSGKDVRKKSKNLVSKDVKKGKNWEKENQSLHQDKTTCTLCLESTEEDWIQCGICKVWVDMRPVLTYRS